MHVAGKDQVMDLVVNGEHRAVDAGATVADLLRTLEIDPASARGIAVAVNDEVVRRQRWAEVRLQEGDHVEVVTARQGG